MGATFAVSRRNTAPRKATRAAYDRDAVYGIVDAALVCHVGYVMDGQPFVIPTLLARDGDMVLLHGHGTARTLLHAGGGNPVYIAVTHVDGVVLARSIFSHSINHRSATLYGVGRLITDPDEKMSALYRFSEKLLPGRWDDVRQMNDQELKATAIIAVEIEDAAAKVRAGLPIDGPEDVNFPPWGGVVPITEQFGEPLPDPHTSEGAALPGYLVDWLESRRNEPPPRSRG
jgi:hypothetical protein